MLEVRFNTIKMNDEELAYYCQKICSIVGEQVIREESVSTEVIRDYYSKSAFYYKKFHSPEGAMHVPIAFSDQASHKQKLLYQADFIHKTIEERGYANILELGCGMGFNTNHLAKKNPDKNFTGVDLTANNIEQARAQSEGRKNTQFYQDDFDQPSSATNAKYDLIFAVETLCHSKNLIQLIKHYAQQLSPKGKLIIFDGYVRPSASTLSEGSEKQAYELLSWGFALDRFQNLNELLEAEKLDQLKVDNITEYTANILPNYLAFQKGAVRALRFPWLLRLLLKSRIISLAFIKQLSAGLFGPYFLHKGYLGYYKLELSPRTNSTNN